MIMRSPSASLPASSSAMRHGHFRPTELLGVFFGQFIADADEIVQANPAKEEATFYNVVGIALFIHKSSIKGFAFEHPLVIAYQPNGVVPWIDSLTPISV